MNESRAEEDRGRRVPVVSILVKALNESANIERCIRSCLAALEGIDGEIVIADSLSDDDTVALAARFPVKVVQLSKREDRSCGVAAQLAYGYARGRYVYIIDGDMELPRTFLGEAVEFLEQHPEIAGVGGQLEEINATADLARLRSTRRRKGSNTGEVDRLNGGGLYRRSAIDEAGGYLTHRALHANEELELALRLRSAGWKVWRTPSVSMRHAGHTQPAFALLARRWSSGYAFGSGELVRSAVGKPYLRSAIREFRIHALVWLWWLALLAAMLVAPIDPTALVVVLVGSVLPVAAMAVRKRSLYLGLYAVVAWHVFAAGALVGFFRMRRIDPRQLPKSRVVHDDTPGASSIADELAGERHEDVAFERRKDASSIESPSQAAAGHGANPYGAKAVRKGLLHFLTGRTYGGVINLVIIALYVRHMTVQDYAAYTTLSALGGVVAMLTLLGMERAAMRYFPEARLSGSVDSLRQIVRTLSFARLVILLVVCAGVLLLSGPILEMLQLKGQELALWMAMSFLLAHSATNFQRYTLQTLMLQKELTQSLVISLTARVVFVLLVLWQFGIMSAAWGIGVMALAEWIQVAMQWDAYRRHTNELEAQLPAPKEPWKPDYSEIARYSLQNFQSTAMRQLTGSATLRLVGATYLPAAAIAAYGLFQSLADRMRMYLPVFLVRTMLEPLAMARYIRDRDFSAFNDVLSMALKLNFLVIAPALGWLALTGDPALALLTGGKFLEFRWVLLLSMLTLVPISHWALLELAANAVGISGLLARGSTIAAVVTVAFVVASQPWAGILGLVLTTALASGIANVYVVNRLRKAGYFYRVDLIGLLRIVINAALASAAGWATSWLAGGPTSRTGAGAALAICIVVFAALHAVNRPFRGSERELLRRVLPRRLRGLPI